MSNLPGIFSLLIGAAGWYYLFYSKAADQLQPHEAARLNRIRGFLRRAGGLVMILLAIAFYAGFETVDANERPVLFLINWLIVAALLFLILLLGVIDLRMTLKLRKQYHDRKP